MGLLLGNVGEGGERKKRKGEGRKGK